MMYRTTSSAEDEFDVFWFEKNLQGDIVAVYNSAGTKVATYTYSDAWGNHSVSYTNGGGSTGAQYNPFRYRGYYYDTDLGMYYLQSRYYDSKICRFINADIYISTGYGIIGNNMFAYCNNIPTCYSDPEGTDLMYDCDLDDDYDMEDDYQRYGGGGGGSGSTGATSVNGYGNASTGVCFIEGTPIKTLEGSVSIENIKAGDYVYAHNPETGETELKPVVQTFVNEATELVHVFVDGEEIICTNEHPFYSPVNGWIAACKLRAGDILVSLNGEYIIVEQVQHEILEAPIKVYNFEVEDFHTYFVGDGDGVLVHNECGWLTIVESSNAYNTVKSFDRHQTANYENTLTKLASGNTSGLNIHTLSNGMKAADLTGFGKGRGGRIIYQVIKGIIEIFAVTTKHYKN